MKFGQIENCRTCANPITPMPLLGWAHVNPLDNLDHDARP